MPLDGPLKMLGKTGNPATNKNLTKNINNKSVNFNDTSLGSNAYSQPIPIRDSSNSLSNTRHHKPIMNNKS